MVGAEFERTTSQLSDVSEFVKQSLIAARALPHIDFVFRLHPRMLANKREKLDSPDLNEIYQILDEAPANAHINQSGDGIGLYDTARIASVGLNHASTSGLEFLLLGIPVIHYDPPRLNAYPPEFGFEVQRLDASELKETINEALSVGWSDSYSIQAYRWLATTLVRSLIHRNSLLLDQSKTESIHETHRMQQGALQFRRMIPESIRERISRYQARKNRFREFRVQRESDSRIHNWRVEARDRLVKMEDGVVWEPLIVQRGEPLTTDVEAKKIQSAVLNFIEQIGGLEIYSLRS